MLGRGNGLVASGITGPVLLGDDCDRYLRARMDDVKGSRPQESIVDGTHRGNAGIVRNKNNQDRSFSPVTAESTRQRMAIRTNRDLQYVLARIGKAAKSNCGRIRCSTGELGPEARLFLVSKLGYSVTYIDEKDKYEVRWDGTEETDEAPAVEIDSEFAEG